MALGVCKPSVIPRRTLPCRLSTDLQAAPLVPGGVGLDENTNRSSPNREATAGAAGPEGTLFDDDTWGIQRRGSGHVGRRRPAAGSCRRHGRRIRDPAASKIAPDGMRAPMPTCAVTNHLSTEGSTMALLTIDEAAQRLGTSTRFIRRLVSERRIAFTRLGRHIRIDSADIDAFIQAGRVEPRVPSTS